MSGTARERLLDELSTVSRRYMASYALFNQAVADHLKLHSRLLRLLRLLRFVRRESYEVAAEQGWDEGATSGGWSRPRGGAARCHGTVPLAGLSARPGRPARTPSVVPPPLPRSRV
jgi:hypothetical protein